MAAKDIIYDTAARDKILAGVNALANAVRRSRSGLAAAMW